MYNVIPKQKCRILTLKIAVPANAKSGEVADQVSALLSEAGCCNKDSLVLDWCYVVDFDRAPVVVAPDDVGEGEIFNAQ